MQERPKALFTQGEFKMFNRYRILSRLAVSFAFPALLVAGLAAAQTRPTPPSKQAPSPLAQNGPAPTDKDVAATQSDD